MGLAPVYCKTPASMPCAESFGVSRRSPAGSGFTPADPVPWMTESYWLSWGGGSVRQAHRKRVGGLALKHCRFRTSYGGTLFCQDPVYLEGFCKFHYKALEAGEINDNGVINERVSDQSRRREINFHGIEDAGPTYLDDLT
jgi:hypothetical protein